MIRSALFLCALLFPAVLFSQHGAALNAKTRAEIVHTISRLLLDNYVFPDTAARMSACIEKRLKQGAYGNITDPVAFSDVLTNDLYSVYRDVHMLVQFVPEQPQQAAAAANVDADPLRQIRRANFGLRKAEILPGNIGYIDIHRFWADSIYGRETVRATLRFVAHADALIIDVRHCGGGSQETVSMICSYFFGQRVHLNDMVDRAAGTTTEYWTTPDTVLPQLVGMPLYILTSSNTFSAAEEFCYDLQVPGRAIIVGESTGGGAHGTFTRSAGHGFELSIPYSMAVNPITRTNWEKTGVTPDVSVAPEAALETAEMLIFDRLIAGAANPDELFALNWERDLLKAVNHPLSLDPQTLSRYAGEYGERLITLEDGKLFYQRTGRPKFELEAMSPTLLKPIGNDYFKVEFVTNETGEVNAIAVYYQDNRMESAGRTH